MIAFKNSSTAKAFAEEFLRRYTEVGFGALSKREVDLLLIELLQTHIPDFKEKTNFDTAVQLRTTSKKIRLLRDEVSFRNANDQYRNDKSYQYLKNKLRQEMMRANPHQGDHDMVKIQIDDALLREYIEKLVRSQFEIVEKSFNSSILQLSTDMFLFLGLMVLKDEELREVTLALDKLQGGKGKFTSDPRKLFERFTEAFVESAGNQSGKLCASIAFALATNGASLAADDGNLATVATKCIKDIVTVAWNRVMKKKETD